eukprot:CAMPEP_0194049612 /NCGR_PEP_ID=MMETSP0009_2-20130614/30787_1 /TAXON_ID=210454 /ORGANISM="Grammatophora oceanica, Strain CCMP 410" /LENGTH=596 /DNA_ID=CAMNT_0038695813 /DNA_START=236 /DNA_END=2026 /DNA_ORIENTATION=+
MQNVPDENLVQSAAKLSELIVQALLKTEDSLLQDSSSSSSGSGPSGPPSPDTGLREKSLSTYLSEESISKSSETKTTSSDVTTPDTSDASTTGFHSPISFLLDELRKQNPPRGSPRTYPALDLKGVFHKHTSEELAAYDRDVITAVNRADLQQLRTLHSSGHLMEASNQFGETLVHGACRRGSLDVTRFLVNEGGATLMCCDQQGMTPLHLACRTPKPNYELVSFILQQDRAHDLIFVADKRGYTPLDCTPSQTWSGWIDFIKQIMRSGEGHCLMPSREMFYTKISSDRNIPATEEPSSASEKELEEPTVNNPLFEDVDALLKSYDAQHKKRKSAKKKRRKSSRRLDTDSSSLDNDSSSSLGSDQETVCTSNASTNSDSNEGSRSPKAERASQLKSDLSHMLLEKLNKSIGSGLSADAEAMRLLEGLNSLDPTTLLETIRLKRTMDFEINHMERVETRYEEKKALFLDIERNYFYHKQQLAQAEATVKQAMAIEIAARKALEHAVEQVEVSKQSYIDINNAYRSLDKQYRGVQSELEGLGRTVAVQQSRIRAQLNPEHRRLEPPREDEEGSESGASESEHSQETIRTKNIAASQGE